MAELSEIPAIKFFLDLIKPEDRQDRPYRGSNNRYYRDTLGHKMVQRVGGVAPGSYALMEKIHTYLDGIRDKVPEATKLYEEAMKEWEQSYDIDRVEEKKEIKGVFDFYRTYDYMNFFERMYIRNKRDEEVRRIQKEWGKKRYEMARAYDIWELTTAMDRRGQKTQEEESRTRVKKLVGWSIPALVVATALHDPITNFVYDGIIRPALGPLGQKLPAYESKSELKEKIRKLNAEIAEREANEKMAQSIAQAKKDGYQNGAQSAASEIEVMKHQVQDLGQKLREAVLKGERYRAAFRTLSAQKKTATSGP